VLYQSYFPPTNFTGYPSSGYQTPVPSQNVWRGQNNSCCSTTNVTQTQHLTSSANNLETQTSLVGMKQDIFAPNIIKKQNNNNLIDLNFFDSIENPKENIATNVRTSVLEAFDPLLYGQTNISSSIKEDQGMFILLFKIHHKNI
jgi:hypothetical protein